MTRQELAERQRRFESEKGLFVVRWIALLLPSVFMPFGVSCVLRYLLVHEWAVTSVAFSGLAGVPLWAWWGDVRLKGLQRDQRLLCPRCNKALIGLTGELAMTTGRCGGCGHIIVTDDASDAPKVQEMQADSPLWDHEVDRSSPPDPRHEPSEFARKSGSPAMRVISGLWLGLRLTVGLLLASALVFVTRYIDWHSSNNPWPASLVFPLLGFIALLSALLIHSFSRRFNVFEVLVITAIVLVVECIMLPPVIPDHSHRRNRTAPDVRAVTSRETSR